MSEPSLPKFKVGDRVRVVNILPHLEFPPEPVRTDRLIQTHVWRNDRPATIVGVKSGRSGFSGNSKGDLDYPKGTLENYSYAIRFDRFLYSNEHDNHTANGYFLEADGPTEEEMQAVIESITKAAPKKLPWETHWIHPAARDPEFEGRSAFCDWMLGLDEEPRTHTLSSAIRDDVDCPLCLSLMTKVGDAYDTGWAHGDQGIDYDNAYWGEQDA